MQDYLGDDFGNAGSTVHEFGRKAERAVERARDQIASALSAAQPSEVVFTSGATESNNLALMGIKDYLLEFEKKHLITTLVEHRSVYNVFEELEARGFEVTYLKPGPDGTLDLKALEGAVTPKTGLVSVMHANNETGTVYPVDKISEIVQRHDVLFHCDAAQSFGKIPLDARQIRANFISISAHKIYGPKGIGALYVKSGGRAEKLKPLMFGGGQERGLRPGTLPVPLIAGFGEAAEIALREMAEESLRTSRLRDLLWQGLSRNCSPVVLNGSFGERLPNNLNVSFPGLSAEALTAEWYGKIAVSSVSSCSSALWSSSRVLKAMGADEERLRGAIRFGLGRFTTEEEIIFSVRIIAQAVQRLKQA